MSVIYLKPLYQNNNNNDNNIWRKQHEKKPHNGYEKKQLSTTTCSEYMYLVHVDRICNIYEIHQNSRITIDVQQQQEQRKNSHTYTQIHQRTIYISYVQYIYRQYIYPNCERKKANKKNSQAHATSYGGLYVEGKESDKKKE